MDCTLGSKTNLIIRAEEINIKKKFFERLNKYAAQMQNLYDKAVEEWINSSGQH